MILGLEIVFANDWSFWVVLAATAILSLLCLWWTRRALGTVSPRWHWAFFALRWLSLMLLIGFLANPVLSYRAFRTKRGGVAVILDTSRSMSVRDSIGGASRFDAAKAFFFDPQKNFFQRLAQTADPYLYAFDVLCAPTTSEKLAGAAAAEGAATNFAAAFKALARQRAAQNLLGVILISDGQDNGSDDALEAARALALPVYAVGVGKQEGEDKRMDRRLAAVRTNPIAVRNTEAVVRVTLQQEGFAGEVLDVRLSDEDAALASERAVLDDALSREVRLTFKPTVKGQRTYKVSIPHDPRDHQEENDSVEFSVLVADSKINLLYVEGTLRWEYKFFKRFLEQDPAVDPTFVILTGPSNVSVQGNKDVKLEGGLPGPYDILAKYDVIVIGDVPKDFFSDAALQRLEKYVSEKGGGVLFIAGYHTMLSGEYKRTPLETIMPVQLKALKTRPPARPVAIQTTALGRSHDVLVGLDRLLNGRKVSNAYSVGSAKPGATVLLEQKAQGAANEPLLVAQTYGAGRTMLVAADRLYEWDFEASPTASSGPAAAKAKGAQTNDGGSRRLWGQMTRWLARQDTQGDANGPLIAAYTDQTYYEPSEAVTVNARVNQRAAGDAKLILDAAVYDAGKKVADVPMRTMEDNQLMRGSMRPPGDGQYRVELTARAGTKETKVSLKFNVGSPSKEMERTRLNEETLRGLAQQTNGGYYSLVGAEDILARLQSGVTQTEHRTEMPLVNSSACFILFVALVFAEWTLRRRKQLI